MRLFEFEAKRIFKAHGIPVPQGDLVKAGSPIRGQPPAVLKAQIPDGGRGKTGGILFASTTAETEKAVLRLLGHDLKGYVVKEVLVEQRVPVLREYYLGVTYDTSRKIPVLVFSSHGGIHVEDMVRSNRRAVQTRCFDIRNGFQEYQGRQVLADAGIEGTEAGVLSEIMIRIVRIFMQLDATIVEINPLAATSAETFLALDGHIEIDDDSLFRHPELEGSFGIQERDDRGRVPTDLEKRAQAVDRLDHRGVAGRLVEFDGDMGLLIGGGGASLTAFDAVRKYGGKPANYCEIGGNPSVRKIKELTALLLSNESVRKIAVIMNVVSNTRVDLVARGVIKGILETGLNPADVIAAFRIPGAWENEGFRILTRYGVEFLDRTVSIDEAAKYAVDKMG